jgi:hypothetical protein
VLSDISGQLELFLRDLVDTVTILSKFHGVYRTVDRRIGLKMEMEVDSVRLSALQKLGV